MSHDPERNKAALRTMFTEVFEASELDEDAVADHFSPSYVQEVDGRTLDYAGFIEHLRTLKREVERTSIEIERLVAEDDAVCSVHRVSATKRDGGSLEGQVIAVWTFGDGLIERCRELTRMTSGSPEDRDLGSRAS